MARLSGSGILVLCFVANAGLSTRSEVPAKDLAPETDDSLSSKVLIHDGETKQEPILNEQSIGMIQDDRVSSFSPDDATTTWRRMYTDQQVNVYFSIRSHSGFATLHYVHIPDDPTTDVYTLVETYLQSHEIQAFKYAMGDIILSMELRPKAKGSDRPKTLTREGTPNSMSGAKFLEGNYHKWNLHVTLES